MGFTKSYVGTLKQKGRLVFVGDKIDFEKSKAKIAKTADITRHNVLDKVAEKEKAAPAPKTPKTPKTQKPKKQKTDAPAPETNLDDIDLYGDDKQKFNRSKAEYQELQAKLKRIEYEKAMRTLGSLDQIQKVGYEIGKIIKTRMATFAIRAAPVVTHETSEKANREYLMREIENVIAEIRDELEQTKGE
ncbi:MAG: hypothetical protein IJR92_04270 [Alphaproteobacteria bacterium]|nr:hypothetical protein [Alphaproteobacteria bacterium]